MVLAVRISGDCPTPAAGHGGWAKNTTVTYDVSGLPSGVQAQASAAFSAWNTANGGNGSGVTFTPGGSAQITFAVGATGGGGPGQVEITYSGSDAASAVITLDLNNPNNFNAGSSGYARRSRRRSLTRSVTRCGLATSLVVPVQLKRLGSRS